MKIDAAKEAPKADAMKESIKCKEIENKEVIDAAKKAPKAEAKKAPAAPGPFHADSQGLGPPCPESYSPASSARSSCRNLSQSELKSLSLATEAATAATEARPLSADLDQPPILAPFYPLSRLDFDLPFILAPPNPSSRVLFSPEKTKPLAFSSVAEVWKPLEQDDDTLPGAGAICVCVCICTYAHTLRERESERARAREG
jgi:hypothetical protein